MTEYKRGDIIGGYGSRRIVKLTLFKTSDRYEQRTAESLEEARKIAVSHVGATPKLEGSGLFGYAFDRLTGNSLRVTSGAKMRDIFPAEAAE